MSNKRRLLIIGLDGATWDIIAPLAARGRLPAFSHLMKNGTGAPLYSTLPPATFPAWTTFFTGKNPGKHGIFDFTEKVPGTYRVRFVNASFRKVESFWQLLSSAGLRVGVMGVPATYPPEDINGFMISGFDSPVARSIDSSFVSPRGLYRDIKQHCGGYAISDVLENVMDAGWYEDAAEKISSGLAKRAETALYLYRKEPWDCFTAVFGETDTASHHFWKFYDSGSPRYMPHAVLSAVIPGVYQQLDTVIGRFLDNLWEDTTVVIVSDHGFGGIGTKAISLNRWLADEGFLDIQEQASFADRTLQRFKTAGLACLPHQVQEKVFRTVLKNVAQRMESRSRFSGIVWNRTIAFSEDMNYFPSIHINLKGREPAGIVEPGNDYEAARDQIIEKITAWQDPVSGRPIVRCAWKREDLFSGDYVYLAPDIILDLQTDNGYSYLCLPYRNFTDTGPFTALSNEQLSGARLLSMSGSHRQEGVALFSGDMLEDCLLQKPSIQDICPTILSFFGFSVPEDMDGRVLPLFKSGQSGLNENRSRYKAAKSIPYTAGQEKIVEERLRRLGYFD